jgi:hypothetical protein
MAFPVPDVELAERLDAARAGDATTRACSICHVPVYRFREKNRKTVKVLAEIADIMDGFKIRRSAPIR